MKTDLPRFFILGALALVPTLIGCAGGGDDASIDQRANKAEHPGTVVSPSEYAAMFDRARNTLRDAGFTIERVDAAAGVITTAPMPGLDAWKSPLLRNAGVAGLRSWHGGTVEAKAVFTTSPAVVDLRTATTPLILRFEVVERREYHPSKKVDTTSVVYGSEFSDRDYARRGLEPFFTVAVDRVYPAEAALSRAVARIPPL
jgi:hypothetical protein